MFSNYLHLLYRGRLPSHTKDSNTQDQDKAAFLIAVSHSVAEEYRSIAGLYVFCEKMQDVSAKCDLVSAFVNASSKTWEDSKRHFPSNDIVSRIYGGTPVTDPLREWLVDAHASHAHSAWVLDSGPEDYHPEFMYAMMVAMIAARDVSEGPVKSDDASTYIKKVRELPGVQDEVSPTILEQTPAVDGFR